MANQTSRRYLHVGTYRQQEIVLDVEGDSLRLPGEFSCRTGDLVLVDRDLSHLRTKIDRSLSTPFEVHVFRPGEPQTMLVLVNYIPSAGCWVTRDGDHISGHHELYDWDALDTAEMQRLTEERARLYHTYEALVAQRRRVFWSSAKQLPLSLAPSEMRGGAPLGSVID